MEKSSWLILLKAFVKCWTIHVSYNLIWLWTSNKLLCLKFYHNALAYFWHVHEWHVGSKSKFPRIITPKHNAQNHPYKHITIIIVKHIYWNKFVLGPLTLWKTLLKFFVWCMHVVCSVQPKWVLLSQVVPFPLNPSTQWHS